MVNLKNLTMAFIQLFTHLPNLPPLRAPQVTIYSIFKHHIVALQIHQFNQWTNYLHSHCTRSSLPDACSDTDNTCSDTDCHINPPIMNCSKLVNNTDLRLLNINF